MAKMTKTTKKVTAPVVAEEEAVIEETAEEVVEEEVIEAPKAKKAVKEVELSLSEQFMAQVDRALENAYKLYEQKYLTREVIQSICNSVLK